MNRCTLKWHARALGPVAEEMSLKSSPYTCFALLATTRRRLSGNADRAAFFQPPGSLAHRRREAPLTSPAAQFHVSQPMLTLPGAHMPVAAGVRLRPPVWTFDLILNDKGTHARQVLL